MHDAAPLAGWANFYVIVGSSAGALTGLTFVVVTIVAGRPSGPATETGLNSVFTAPMVVLFCTPLLLAGILTAPWPSLSLPAGLLAATGLAGSAYAVWIGVRAARLRTYQADRSDWLWYVIVPLAGYAAILIDGLLLTRAPQTALAAIAAAVMLLLFTGIHNAWDVVTFVAFDRDGRDATTGRAPDAAADRTHDAAAGRPRDAAPADRARDAAPAD